METENFIARAENSVEASPTLYGLFFEDINHALDGGINANLVQNGFFDFCHFTYGAIDVKCVHDNLRFWSCEPQKCVCVTNEKPIHENKPFAIKVVLQKNDGDVILKNFGYDTKNNQNYMFLDCQKCECSFFYQSYGKMKIQAFFEYEDGTISKATEIDLKTTKTNLNATNCYQKTKFLLSCKSGSFARLCFKIFGEGQAFFTGFRLIPNNFFKSKKNSYLYGKLNARLVESLKMGAKFLRFPGGCLVEGDVCSKFLFDWEKTIGPIEQRVSKPSVWNYTQTNEIGFFEYFCLCEDLDLLPLPVHHVGINCQIRTEVFRHEGYKFIKPNTQEFKEKVIDSVAHLIYFAKGDVLSADATEREWAKKRRQMGHAQPFDLRFVALGNENWDKVYFKNFEAAIFGLKNFEFCGQKTDILEKFHIQIVISAGVDINPQDTNFSWQYITKHHKNLIVDEHVYNTPQWFVDNFYRYNFYDENQSKVFMGEYACHTNADGKGLLGGKNTFLAAISEAVFMCGFENNPKIVKMSCYAPLFCRSTSANWDPDLIYFQQNKVQFTSNYFVQKLFMENYGTSAIKLECKENFQNGGIFSIKTNKNKIKRIFFDNLDDVPMQLGIFDTLETSKELENFSVNIVFKKLIDDFTICLGKQKSEGFGFYIHYNHAENKLYFEKVVDGFRMTFEEIAHKALAETIKIEYTTHSIKIFNVDGQKTKLVACKKVWKTNRSVFASLTYDTNQVYIKAVNISNQKQDAQFFVDEKIVPKKKTQVKITTLTANQFDSTSVEQNVENLKISPSNLKIQFPPKSVNVIVVKR